MNDIARRKSVVVVGGGVAGIACATSLSDHDIEVTLVEKRLMLGGRASSWIDHDTGEILDACQHGTMRCCTNLTKLLVWLGVNDQIQYHDTIQFIDSDNRRSVIKGCGLPAPGHTAISFLAFRSLGIGDKIAIARGMLKMLRTTPSDKLDGMSIGSWFQRNNQPENAVKRFWEPILVSACNETLDRITCGHAFKIFRDGFLCNDTAFHFGIPRVPLGTLYTHPTIQCMNKNGSQVMLRTIVKSVEFELDKVTSMTLSNGTELSPDYVVFALQQDLLLKMLPDEIVHKYDYFRDLKNIETSPIVGIHLWYEGKIDSPDALALLDRETDWIFNKNKNFQINKTDSTYLSLVISGSRMVTDMSKEDILEMALAEVNTVLPQTRSARLLKSYVLKERKATFSALPGIEKLRPSQESPLANVAIAGEWTDTGWPSTMESAARSGFLAAEVILSKCGIKTRLTAPDMPMNGLARFITRV